MKKYLLFVLTVLMTSVSFAWSFTTPHQKEYTIKFKLKAETFEYTGTAPSYEEAFDLAAQECFKFFKGGRSISEDRGLDIIDSCANPRD